MLGFIELFLLWVVLAVWAGVLAGRRGAPERTRWVTWITGVALSLCVLWGGYGLVELVTAPPRTPDAPGPVANQLVWALYAAHAVLALGYLSLLGITGFWLTRREG